MRLRNGISVEENAYRMSVISEDSNKIISKMVVLIIAALLISLFIGYNGQLALIKSYGPGNPYNCESCKNLGRACKEHRNFDRSKSLNDKIYFFVDRYDIESNNEYVSKYAMYGYGNEYNTNCDFCNNNKTECYSCKFDREYIERVYREKLNNNEISARLCNNCWEVGKPECDMCKEMVTKLILDEIHKE